MKHRRTWKDARYLAWIISGNPEENIALVDLGLVREIDSDVEKGLKLIASTRSRLGGMTEEAAFEADCQALKGLHDRLWDRLEGKLGNANRVYISPDAGLWSVPWNCLMTEEGKFVVESRSIVLLGTPRDLVPVAADLKPPKKQPALTALAMSGELPNTLLEAKEFANALNLKEDGHLFVDAKATKQLLQETAPGRIVFIGAHTRENQNGEDGPDQPLPVWDDLLANNSVVLWPGKDGSDGRLTGLEILDLPLTNTDLVVLAVCEAATGEAQTNDGVASLQNAFCTAGARHVIGTLWELPGKVGTTPILESIAHDVAKLDPSEYSDLVTNAQRQYLKSLKPGERPFAYYWGGCSLIRGPRFEQRDPGGVPSTKP